MGSEKINLNNTIDSAAEMSALFRPIGEEGFEEFISDGKLDYSSYARSLRGNASSRLDVKVGYFNYSNYMRSQRGGNLSCFDASEPPPNIQCYSPDSGSDIVPYRKNSLSTYGDTVNYRSAVEEIDRSGLGRFKYIHDDMPQLQRRLRHKDYMVDSLLRKVHKRADKYTKENIATDAAHGYEQALEGSGRLVLRAVRKHYNRPHWRAIPTVKTSASPAAQSTYKIKQRAMLAQNRVLSLAAKNGGHTVGGIIGNAVKSLVVKSPVVLVIVAGLFFILMYQNMLSGTVITVITSFTADEATASGVVEYIQQLDANLASEIESIPDGYTDIDEVDLNFSGVIATNPTHIMAYLTVKYNDFTLDQVRDDLNDIHKTLYTVEQEVETQIKQRTETDTYTDPITGEEFSEEREVEYEYNILHITVTCRQFSDYAAELIDADDMDWYELLVETGGNMMLGGNLGNPFVGVDWRSFVTTPYGYRINPVDQRREFHPAIDISWGGINGTPINAVHDGIVIQAVHGDATYGNYIMLEDVSQNLRTRYSHCDSLLVGVGQEIKRGDDLALVGSTGKSTGPHLDIEVYRDGRSMNPITELAFN